MARRSRAQGDEPPPESYGERRGVRPARRKKGNEGLWIALGAAGVLGIVFLFWASGSSGMAEKEAGTAAFKKLVKAALENNAPLGVTLINTPEAVLNFKKDTYRKWETMSKDERELVLIDVYKWHRQKITDVLQVKSVRDMEKYIESGRVEWVPNPGQVEIRWEIDPPHRSIQHWVVIVKEIDGFWLVTKFLQQE